MVFRNREPVVHAHLLKETVLEDFAWRQTQEEVVRKNASGIWDVRPMRVLARITQFAPIERQKLEQRLEQAPANRTGHPMIERKVLIVCIARVPGEELVATISRQQRANAVLTGQQGAVVRANCRRVGERLVVTCDDLLQRFRGVSGGQPFFMVLGLKVRRGGTCKLRFAEARLLKCNREGLRRAVFLARECYDRTAVGAATQIAACLRLQTAFEMAMH